MGLICSKANRLKIPQKVLNTNLNTPKISKPQAPTTVPAVSKLDTQSTPSSELSKKKPESLSKLPNEQSQKLYKPPGFIRNVSETAAGVVLGNAISRQLSANTNSRPVEDTAKSPTKTDNSIDNELENKELTGENKLQGQYELTEYDKEEENYYDGDGGENYDEENDDGDNDDEH